MTINAETGKPNTGTAKRLRGTSSKGFFPLKTHCDRCFCRGGLLADVHHWCFATSAAHVSAGISKFWRWCCVFGQKLNFVTTASLSQSTAAKSKQFVSRVACLNFRWVQGTSRALWNPFQSGLNNENLFPPCKHSILHPPPGRRAECGGARVVSPTSLSSNVWSRECPGNFMMLRNLQITCKMEKN